MKIKAGQLKALASDLTSSFKAFLIYGTDTGAIDEAAGRIQKMLADQKPLAVTDLTVDRLRETPTLFWDEVGALSMFGDRRLIRFKNPSDTFVKEMEAYLNADTGDAFVLMTADNLNTKSALVKLADGADRMGSLGCYPQEENDVRATIAGILSENGFIVAPEALVYLAQNLGADKGITLSEIQKLMLFMGDEKQVTLAHAEAAVGNGSAVSVDDLIMHVLSGQAGPAQRDFELLLQEGTASAQLTRAFVMKLNQLLIVLSKMKKGEPVDTAIRGTPPFIPFKYGALWKRIVLSWPESYAMEALDLMLTAEKNVKSGLPADLVCNRALTGLTAAGKKFLAGRR